MSLFDGKPLTEEEVLANMPRQCEKCRMLGCDRGPGFADIADDPPSPWRCPCKCHPVNSRASG